MKAMKVTTLMLLCTIAGCANAGVEPELQIHGLKIADNKLQLEVTSFGCTSEKSLQLDWQNERLRVARIKPDHCRRMPHRIWLEFDLPENIGRFTLENKIAR